MKRKTNVFIYPLAIMLLILAISYSCKKKKDDNTTPPPDVCTAVSNANAVNIGAFVRPVGIAISSSQRVAVSEYWGMDVYGGWIGNGVVAPVLIYASMSDVITNNVYKPINTTIAPEAVCFDAAENLYITETETTAGISIYMAPDYTYLKTIQPGYFNPRGTAVDAEGNIYLADDGNHKVVKITDAIGAANQTDFVVLDIADSPKAVAISGNNIFIASYTTNKVYKYNLTNATLAETLTIDRPIDLHVSGCMLYVTSHGGTDGGYGTSSVKAYKLDALNAGIQKEYTGFSGIVFGIASDNGGNLYISDFTNGVIRKYTK